jgi:hypothetical protein
VVNYVTEDYDFLVCPEDEEEFQKDCFYDDEELLEDKPVAESEISCDDLPSELRDWVLTTPNTPHAKISDLLKILKRYQPGLPACYSTLMKVPEQTNRPTTQIVRMGNGEYAHFGLTDKVKSLSLYNAQSSAVLDIDLGIDGLPVFKSSTVALWPIMCYFSNIPKKIKPFPIGIFYGHGHPENVDEFFTPFAGELTKLMSEGVIAVDGKIKKINVRMLAVDTPARGFVTGTVGHSSKNGCNQCEQEAVYDKALKKLIFADEKKTPRTDEKFSMRSNPLHHKKPYRNNKMVLEKIPNFGGLVSKVPIDPMHNIDLGVTRKILLSIHCQNKLKIKSEYRQKISENYVALAKFIPTEFARATRSLNILKFWKATEFRLFIMYTGLLYFKQLKNERAFQHFLLLHISIRFMANENLYLEKATVSQCYIEQFVKQYKSIYTVENFTYNTHALLHLVEGSQRFGPLYEYSCYKFENFFGELKTYIRSRSNILQQIVNQIDRRRHLPNYLKKHDTGLMKESKVTFPGCEKTFSSYQFDKFVLSGCQNDNCCYLDDGVFLRVHNFSILKNNVMVVGQKITDIQPFFIEPVNSLGLGIALSNGIQKEITMYPIADIKFKCVRLPIPDDVANSSLIIPMVHTM